MPFVHGKSTAVFLGGTDVSSFLNSVDQTITRDVSESSTFGATAKSYLKGHKDGTISLSGYWDGASGAIDSVMASALGNEVLGYGSELLTPSGDSVAAYTALAQAISNSITPIAGFTNSVDFADNLAIRAAYKGPGVSIGVKYLMTCYIQMNSGAAPVIGPDASGNDLNLVIGGNIATTTTSNTSVQLVSGSIYLVSLVYTPATLPQSSYNGVRKSNLHSANGFKIAGLSLRAVATVQQTRQVDTYGPELLTAGEDVTDYPDRSNISQAITPISGFAKSIYFQNASVLRNAYKQFTPISGTPYRFSAIIKMDNDAIPVASTDFSFRMRGSSNVNNFYDNLVESLGNNIYRVSVKDREFNTFNNFGIVKFTTQTSTGFRVSGYSLRQITAVTVPTAPPLSICEAGTSTAGLRALVVQAHDTSYQVTGITGDTVAVSAEFQVDGSFGSGAFRGVVLAPLASYSTGTNTTAVDNGSTTFGGLVANFHVLSNAEWVRMKIQHSIDNSTWVDLLTSTSFSQNSSEHLVTPNVVYRYLRVNITASGSTTPRLIVTAARK